MKSAADVDPEIMADAQRLANERGVSIDSVLEHAMRELLARHASRHLPMDGGTGVRPGVNLDRTCELLELMEGDDPR